MSRTHRDSWKHARRDLEVVKRDGGTFDFFRNGNLACQEISERALADELARFGYCGSEFYEILREVSEKGSKVILL